MRLWAAETADEAGGGGVMKKLQNRRGELLAESLLTLLILTLTGMVLVTAAASTLRPDAQTAQTAFVDTADDTSVTFRREYTVSLGGVELGTVTVKEQGGLYYYDAAG